MRRTARTRIASACLLAASLLVSSHAFADARTEAKSHFKKGMGLISDGKYEEGISELQRAYEILPHPNVLYNIARAYAESGDLEGAVASYKKYLEGNPPDRDEVSQIVANLEARIRRQQAAAAQAAQAVPVVTPTTPSTTGPTPTPTPGTKPAPGTATPEPRVAAEPKIDVGQAKTEDVFEETVVTASKGAQSPLDAPSSTSIITEQDIRLSGITKIPELLRRLAGVDIMEPSAGQPEVSLRGFNQRISNKVLVLVNGRSVFVDLIGATLWPSLSIGVEDIERIEVVRGPGSALYGADAFNGVINIITKAPGEGKSGVNAGYGTDGATHGSLWATGREGAFAWRAAAGYDYVPVWSREAADDRKDLKLVTPDQDVGQKTVRTDLRMTEDIKDVGTVGLGGGLTQGPFELQAYSVAPYVRFKSFTASDVTAFFNAKHIDARVFWNRFDTGDYGLNAAYVGQSLLKATAVVDVIDGEVQYIDQFETGRGIRHDLHLGLGYRFKGVSWTWQDRDRSENHESAYIHDEVKLGSVVAVVGDVRGDYVPYLAQLKPSARGALLVHPSERSTIRASVATAFRTPTLLESYFLIDAQTPLAGAGGIAGSLHADDPAHKVKSEQIVTAELGYSNQDSDFVSLDASLFYNHVDNLINVAPIRPLTVTDLAQGTAEFDTQAGLYPAALTGFQNQCQAFNVVGAELGARTFPAEGVDLYANYTFMNVKGDKSGCSEEQRALVSDDQRTSTHKVNAGLQIRTRAGIDGSVDFHYVSPQTWAEQIPDFATQTLVYRTFPLAAYTLLNARIGYRFFRNQAEVSAMAFNLLGVEHREHPFGQLVGRRMMGFLTYRF